ncbi:MAG: hypothetical protein NVS2B4_08800 [Ramlibacter sp.]
MEKRAMRTDKFKAVMESVASLTETQLDQLVQAVEQRRGRTKALRVLETARDASTCLHCGSATVVKNGHSCGLQRYRCRTCKRTFNATTGTTLGGLHSKERFFQHGAAWPRALRCARLPRSWAWPRARRFAFAIGS